MANQKPYSYEGQIIYNGQKEKGEKDKQFST
jgi:hypothetical protein